MGSAFHAWSFVAAQRLGILRRWAASALVTFDIGAGTAAPSFPLVRDMAAARAAATTTSRIPRTAIG